MLYAVSATHLVMERPGFGQRVIPRPGSVLASPVCAHYDPDPDYFFHWFRDAAIVVDALRVAVLAGFTERSGVARLSELLQFTRALHLLEGGEFLERSHFRTKVQPAFLQYLRPDAEIATLSGDAVLADARVNPDGTPDFTRWSRPQNDAAGLGTIALLRWWREFPELRRDPTLDSLLIDVIRTDLAFTLARIHEPCVGIWEEGSGHHYYTQLVQAEALQRGAEWLEARGESDSVHAARLAAEETLAILDGLWSEADGFYRSQAATGPADAAHLDIAVILAVLHAGRAEGRHSVLDPHAQATLAALEELFETEFAINRARPQDRGPALGRYASDRYYGGGAWYLTTLAAAEFYFKLAHSLRSAAAMPVVPANERFRQRLAPTSAARREDWARLAGERGDAILRTVRAFTPASGELSEQFDRSTGAQTSAKNLSWSYAAFITAAASRAEAGRSIRAADPGAMPAGMA
jgi:glucoamylase